MTSPLERRRFSRFIIPLPVRYQTHAGEGAEPSQGLGIIRDISLSGSFFHVNQPTDLQPGQILSLTIAAPLPFLDNSRTSYLKAQGEVIRLEPPSLANPNYGVAVSFLQNLSFAVL
jgi:hypothetical protein